jgi:uncharacterized protein with PhoU and TrkA domain
MEQLVANGQHDEKIDSGDVLIAKGRFSSPVDGGCRRP